MGINWALKTGYHTTIHLGLLELREQLVHRQSVILLRLKNGLGLSIPNCMIQRVQEFRSSVIIIVREHGHIGPHVVPQLP
jgi:hypothetical protein